MQILKTTFFPFPLCSPSDCTLPFLLQHFWHRNLVPHPFHEAAHQAGQRAGEPHSQVPLVCHPLPHPLLPGVSPDRIWPVHGRLAGPGGRGRAPRGAAHCGHHHQCDAEPLAGPPAQGVALLGLPATPLALNGTVGRRGDLVPDGLQQALLLLLQMQVLQR